jgi:hypothetical protein
MSNGNQEIRQETTMTPQVFSVLLVFTLHASKVSASLHQATFVIFQEKPPLSGSRARIQNLHSKFISVDCSPLPLALEFVEHEKPRAPISGKFNRSVNVHGDSKSELAIDILGNLSCLSPGLQH